MTQLTKRKLPTRVSVRIYDEDGKKYYHRDMEIPHPVVAVAVDVERMLTFNETLLGKPVHTCDIEDNDL